MAQWLTFVQAREFKPERVYGENFEKLPVSSGNDRSMVYGCFC